MGRKIDAQTSGNIRCRPNKVFTAKRSDPHSPERESRAIDAEVKYIDMKTRYLFVHDVSVTVV